MMIEYNKILQSVKAGLKSKDITNLMAIRHMFANLYVPNGEERSAE